MLLVGKYPRFILTSLVKYQISWDGEGSGKPVMKMLFPESTLKLSCTEK